MGSLDLYSQSYLGNDIPEFQLANQWILQFEDFQDYDFLVQESNLPLFSIEVDRVNIDLIVPKGKNDYRTFSITYRERRDFKGFNYHWEWFNSIYDFEKRLFKKTFHISKKQAEIKFISNYNLLSPIGAQLGQAQNVVSSVANLAGIKIPRKDLYRTVQNQAFKLIGIQLTGLEDVSLDNETGDPLTFTVNYEIQQVIPIMGKTDI